MGTQGSTQLNENHYKKLLQICLEKQGALLSGARVENGRVTLKCAFDHVWIPLVNNVLRGSWCGHPECVSRSIARGKTSPNIKSQTEKALEIISARGGKWLSGDYTNSRTPIVVECARGHSFDVTPSSLFAGTWCARCSGKLPKGEALQHLQELAERRGGRLLSKEYKDVKTKLQFQCGNGHSPWWARPEAVLRLNTWCPKCAPNGVKLDEAELTAKLQSSAATKGGKLIQLETSTSRGRYKAHLECAAGHRWTATSYHVLKGSWCPVCHGPGVREKICRALFEHMTGKSFGKHRPNWLRNSRGRKMELDGYNDELRLAFEYQGEQHSRHVAFFHREEGEFEKRVEDDRRKKELCDHHGVTLLAIEGSIPLEELQIYLTKRLEQARPNMSNSLNYSKFDITSVATGKEVELERLKEIAASHGGDCLSEHYISNSTKMRFRCSLGHSWEAVPSSVFQGTWCPSCKGKKISAVIRAKRDVMPLLSIIKGHGGKLIAQIDVGRWQLNVECSAGHRWITGPATLRKGHWCQKCSSRKSGEKLKLSITDLQSVAEQRGGALISRHYIKSGTPYLWECALGHKWVARANSVRRGTWCPSCAGKRQFVYQGDVDEFLAAEKAAAEANII